MKLSFEQIKSTVLTAGSCLPFDSKAEKGCLWHNRQPRNYAIGGCQT